MRIWKHARLALLAATVSWASTAVSADYPNRPIIFVVPFAAGTTTDGAARVVSQHMAKTLGQPVVIENKAGGSGTIGTTYASRAKPDGYTLLFATSATQVIGPHVVPNLPWDPLKSFAPIGLVGKVPQMLAVTNGMPVNTVKEFIDYAKANPGKLSYATLGPSTTASLVTSLFMQRAGIEMVQVPYSTPAMIYPDVITGRVEVVLDNLTNVLPHAKAGKLRALGVTSQKRMDVVPDVPTMSEAGLTDFEVGGWFGLVAPVGTPTEALSILNDALVKAVNSPEYQQWLALNGGQAPAPEHTKPEQFAAFIERELAMWKSAVELAGVRAK
jgi:tripartite-type tricarboxylate transporter receptor subunit TctC